MATCTETVDRVVEQIVAAVDPLRIILFGSAARGELGADSDLDVLVVVPDGQHTRKVAQHIHRSLHRIGRAVDVVVATPSILARHRHNIGFVYKAILDEGREVYAA